MVVGSLVRLVDKIKTVTDNYILVEKFDSDFESELQNYVTKDSKFFSIFVAIPKDEVMRVKENVNSFSIDVFCYAPIQADRSNILSVVSDASLILADLYRDLQDDEDEEFDLMNEQPIYSQNNSRLDYLAGATMRLDFDGVPVSRCAIPKKNNYVV
tara:strand:+ start:1481 stop:1948 length:468 start_codon:yes stop_codon:yes gene_type:complete